MFRCSAFQKYLHLLIQCWQTWTWSSKLFMQIIFSVIYLIFISIAVVRDTITYPVLYSIDFHSIKAVLINLLCFNAALSWWRCLMSKPITLFQCFIIQFRKGNSNKWKQVISFSGKSVGLFVHYYSPHDRSCGLIISSVINVICFFFVTGEDAFLRLDSQK